MTVIRDARIGPNTQYRGTGLQLNVSVHVPAGATRIDQTVIWEVRVLEGAVAQQLWSGEPALRDVIGRTKLYGVRPDGSRIGDSNDGRGFASPNQVFTSAPSSVLTARFRSLVATVGLHPDEVRVLRPRAAAMLVVVSCRSVDDLRHGEFQTLWSGMTALHLEGTYLQLKIGGRVAATAFGVPELAMGGGGTASPSLDAVIGFTHG